MATFLAPAAYAASKSLAAQELSAKRSHLSEIIAALLGYRTLAALTSEELDPGLNYHLDDAEFIVLNQPMGIERAATLNQQASVQVVAYCVAALKDTITHAQVCDDISDFYDTYGRQALAETIYEDEDVAISMAESNASFVDEPELSIECPPTEDLWTAVNEWKIQSDGDMIGEYDPNGDRMFNGDTLKCRGWLVYQKAGRAGLVFLEGGAGAAADDSWRDQDYEDEQAYFAYQQSLKP